MPSRRHYLPPLIVLVVTAVLFKALKFFSSEEAQTLLIRSFESQLDYGVEIPSELLQSYLLPNGRDPLNDFFVDGGVDEDRGSTIAVHPHLSRLFTCPIPANPHTDHIRLPVLVHNIFSQLQASQQFNPTIIALPPGAPHPYLLVSRVVTSGLHQESRICLADICPTTNITSSTLPTCPESVRSASSSTEQLLYCAEPATIVNIPPTPAWNCTGAWSSFPGIPGFHDPRVFWTGTGEPLILINSASQYGCVGLWALDLRAIYPPLKEMSDKLETGSGSGRSKLRAKPTSYPTLTEITRSPSSARNPVEKNWFFFSDGDETFVHYDIAPALSHGDDDSGLSKRSDNDFPSSHTEHRSTGRAFAKLIGNGFTTGNLALTDEPSCLPPSMPSIHSNETGLGGHWHQSSNALQLILCTGAEARSNPVLCDAESATVNFALVHRKFSNKMELPRRYERWFMAWEVRKPFRMLARSRSSVLFWNETVGGWDADENWELEREWFGSETGDLEGHGEASNGSMASQMGLMVNNVEVNETTRDAALNGTTSNSTYFYDKTAATLHRRHAGHSTHTYDHLHHNETSSPARANSTPPFSITPTWRSNINTFSPYYFTYTPSIAWAWRPRSAFEAASQRVQHSQQHQEHPRNRYEDNPGDFIQRSMHIGYLDDEIILGIGLEDKAQAWVKVKAAMVLGCMVACPGVEDRLSLR